MSETQLYRHYDADGNLLYVGITIQAMERLRQHRRNANWYSDIARVEIENYPTRKAACDAERNAVKTERPMYNIVHREPVLGEIWTRANDKKVDDLIRSVEGKSCLFVSSLSVLGSTACKIVNAVAKVSARGAYVYAADTGKPYRVSAEDLAILKDVEEAGKALHRERWTEREEESHPPNSKTMWCPDAETEIAARRDWLENTTIPQSEIERRYGVGRSTLRRRFGTRPIP